MERIVYEKSDLVRQLRALGLNEGDTVLARVDFQPIGRLKKPGDHTLIESLLEAIGRRGTLLAQTHSPVQWIFQRDKSYVYEPRSAPCVTGRFANAVLQHENSYRSEHPTASMAAIGLNAREILGDHDHRATAFAPVKKLIAMGGKFILIGCTVSSPGFSTAHFVYEELGLATHSLLSGLIGCYFRKGFASPWFRQYDIPGCSLGFHKFYPLYGQALHRGVVGRGESYLIDTRNAFQIELEAVRKSPKSFLCDNPDCFSCRGTKLFNWRDMPAFYLRRVSGRIYKRLMKGRP